MNIEEARQKLEDVAGNFYLARTSIMEAADAYALAVLDEAKECVVPPSAGWDDEVLRERLEELGK